MYRSLDFGRIHGSFDVKRSAEPAATIRALQT